MKLSLFTRKAPEINGYQFDAVLEDSLELDIEYPDYAVESGARVVDHSVIKPIRYSIVGAVSNNPLTVMPIDFLGGAISNLLSGNPLAAFAPGLSASFLSGVSLTRASSAMELMITLATNRIPFFVDAVDVQLHNMVIERLRRDRDPENEDGAIFVAELRELITVDRLNSRIGSNPDDMREGDPIRTAAGSQNNRGQETGSGVNDAVATAVDDIRNIQGVPL